MKRSFIIALILGSILTLINQSNAVFGDEAINPIQLALAFVTPFAVIAFSQLGAIRQFAIERSFGQSPIEPARITETIISHNIPFRAVMISLIAGGLSSTIIVANTLATTGDITHIPLPQVLQSFMLPLIFSAFSQVVTYRRSVVQSAV